ncbi:DMT family transporter [Wenzhouxiangella sp. XN201]|uniref:DMT family transporter n=1 Tax=Wenzhouxiangella sp. XN201 TaxID=2710755 RepID=UPI0013C85BEA|nr:DMT family transporter [Wenzhouxiangella sp. XN201]NEZ02612.1 DMT family transporter [Wenzhouxiangella sp. XN201]
MAGRPARIPPMPLSHLLFLLFICLLWAGNFIAAAWAVRFFEPVSFTVVRFALVLLLLLPFLRLPARDQWKTLLACCWTMGAIHFALVFLALGRSEDVSSIVLLMQVYVPLSTLMAVLVLGERIGWRTTSGILIAFGGVLVMGLDPLVLSQLDVMALVLVSALSLATGTILMRRLQGIGVFSFQAWNALLSVIPLMLLAIWLETPSSVVDLSHEHPEVWLAVGYSAVASSIIGHGGFYWLIQRHEVNRITPFLLLVPILAVLLGILVWGDRPGPRLLTGGALVLIGVLWITLRSRWRRRVRTEPRPPAA